MRARIIGLATAAALAVPAAFGHVSTASAYTAQFFVTGYVLLGYTATGTYVHPGTCAVDPRVIPLGSYFTISGIGTCHAEDTGGAIIGYRIDVWVPTVSQAYALTGWYTVTWGETANQQVLGFSASQPQAPVYHPAPQRPPAVNRTYTQTWYSHAHAYFHQDARDAIANRSWYTRGNSYVHPTTYSNAPSGPQPAYILISIHGKGCQTSYPTTYSTGRTQHHWTTTCH